MNNKYKLISIKIFHTAIWLFYALIIFYITYAGIANKLDLFLFICIALVFIEGIILILFKWRCPLTIIAYKYAENKEPGFDIYLPGWLAINNKLIFTVLFIIGLIISILRIVKV